MTTKRVFDFFPEMVERDSRANRELSRESVDKLLSTTPEVGGAISPLTSALRRMYRALPLAAFDRVHLAERRDGRLTFCIAVDGRLLLMEVPETEVLGHPERIALKIMLLA